jgi:acyl transferase domain-containing protein
MVLVKRLDRALEDGDRIHAVIKGLAINNDGRSLGAAAPNPQAQKDVMQAALAKSGKLPQEIDYIEVNGSGTLMTDLVELKSIESVYRHGSSAPCHLGSMKPNIGHPLCAEGMAGFIKVVLMLSRGQWVPFLSAQQPMLHYDLSASPFRFSRELTPWQGTPRVAALNCFADGGTNAHVVLQAWGMEHKPLPTSRAALDSMAALPLRADALEASAFDVSDFWSCTALSETSLTQE